MPESNGINFNLIPDKATGKDLSGDQTHFKIATTLKKLIEKEQDGLTIGLEGGWGSGKSSIVKILRNELSKHENIQYFYFDAWAHEGDPLRRIFLESLIKSIDPEGKSVEFGRIKNKINNKVRKSKVRSKSGATTLGKYFSLSALFVPAGAGILSNIDFSKVTFNFGNKPHWLLILALLMSFAPLFVVLCNILKLKFVQKIKLKQIFSDPKLWPILSSDTYSTTTQEFSEEEERTSLEFEKYFNEIVHVLFNGDYKCNKLVIVVDNLDRVNANVALALWSTLQTFLQQKNPTSLETDEGEQYKIYTIVPYDENGLRKLWDKDGEFA